MIIAEVLSGKTERFGELVGRYQHALIHVATGRLGRLDLAEDATQEAFLCAFKSLATYDSRYSFRTWLWTILLNQCRRAYQKSQRRPRVDPWTPDCSEMETGTHDEQDSPSARLMARESAEQLERLLSELPESQADAVRLRFYGELKYHEIAEAMQCSLSTAKNRVKWGLVKISQQLVPGEPS